MLEGGSGAPRSLTKTKGDLTSCSRCSRRRTRNSLPVNGCVAGLPCLTLRTCRSAFSSSPWQVS